MKYLILPAFVLGILLQSILLAQSPDQRLPNGKLWVDEISRANHEQNVKDATELAELSAAIRDELKDGEWFVLSLETLKKLEDAEDLAKKIRERMERN